MSRWQRCIAQGLDAGNGGELGPQVQSLSYKLFIYSAVFNESLLCPGLCQVVHRSSSQPKRSHCPVELTSFILNLSSCGFLKLWTSWLFPLLSYGQLHLFPMAV